ncbi:hypothetical protein QFC19_009350 [Naganishia cerealis]|uniref:Uncharacterized protein n=1 Tax=Naganishia cerealis TaxID=610337 RepID=A0ACC2UV51_9TREE|nr:hypothetical protein QFC19_009350 [Naganishia cerealis]
MQRVNQRLAVQVMQECRKKGFGYEEYKKELKRQLAEHQAALLKKHNCHPLATGLLPAFIHIPIFLLLSLTIRQAAALATPAPIDPSSLETTADVLTSLPAHASFANEHVLWLSSLIDPDPSLIIPLAVGLMAFANVEVMQNWRGATSAAAGEPTVQPIDPKVASSTVSAAQTPLAQQQKPAKLKPNFGRISSVQKRSIIQDETAAGNMTPAEQRKRELLEKGGTMRERVVGNVMRILAVVMVGIAAELPAVRRLLPPRRVQKKERGLLINLVWGISPQIRRSLFTGLHRPGIPWCRISFWGTSINARPREWLRELDLCESKTSSFHVVTVI